MKKILGACHPTTMAPQAVTFLMQTLLLVDLLRLTVNRLIRKVRDVNFLQPNDTFNNFTQILYFHQSHFYCMRISTPQWNRWLLQAFGFFRLFKSSTCYYHVLSILQIQLTGSHLQLSPDREFVVQLLQELAFIKGKEVRQCSAR